MIHRRRILYNKPSSFYSPCRISHPTGLKLILWPSRFTFVKVKNTITNACKPARKSANLNGVSLFFVLAGRTLLMLQSIKRAHRLDANNPDLHSCLVLFMRHTDASQLEGAVAEVVKRQTSEIFSNLNASQFNANFLKKNSKSLPHLFQAARMMYLLDPSAQAKALSLATNLNDVDGVTLPICVRVLDALRNNDFGPCDTAIADYIEKCHKRFPYATAFRPPEPKMPIANHQDKENSITN